MRRHEESIIPIKLAIDASSGKDALGLLSGKNVNYTCKLYFLKPVKREIVFVMWIKICRKILTLTRQQILKIYKLGKNVQLRCYILCYYIL